MASPARAPSHPGQDFLALESLKEGPESPVKNRSCSGRHKARLLVGEGNFSFALALITKHDTKWSHSFTHSLGCSVTATDLKVTMPTPEIIAKLNERGVLILPSIDGTKLHEYFPDQKFSRIHWNCPHDGSEFSKQTLPPIIALFFHSCRNMQETGDRVHMALAQPPGKKAFYQGYVYDIVNASANAGYRILKKRQFGADRYPGYQHVQTIKNESASVTDQGQREFVFEKIDDSSLVEARQNTTDPPSLATALAFGSKKTCAIQQENFYGRTKNYFKCSTDDDSSSGEEECLPAPAPPLGDVE